MVKLQWTLARTLQFSVRIVPFDVIPGLYKSFVGLISPCPTERTAQHYRLIRLIVIGCLSGEYARLGVQLEYLDFIKSFYTHGRLLQSHRPAYLPT